MQKFDKITHDCENISDIYHDDALFQEIQLFKSIFEEIIKENSEEKKVKWIFLYFLHFNAVFLVI